MIVEELNEYKLTFAEHVIVYVTNEAEYAIVKSNGLLQAFFKLYENGNNFTDENELEKPSTIEERLLNYNNIPNIFIAIYTLTDRDGNIEIAGGTILEYYAVSSCAFVSYLFVKKKRRGIKFGKHQKKISTRLGNEAIYFLTDYIDIKYNKVKAILFAVNNPISTLNDSIDPNLRLRFFKKLDAKWIDFIYVQPPLNADLNSVTNLNLCVIPIPTSSELKISIFTLINFYIELTYSLAEADTNSYSYSVLNFKEDLMKICETEQFGKVPYKDVQLAGITNNSAGNNRNYIVDTWANLIEVSQDGYIILKELPLNEEPKINFKRASVCMQLLVDEDDLIPEGLSSNYITQFERKQSKFKRYKNADNTAENSNDTHASLYCPIFHSFETALFAKSFQADPPYFSKVYELSQDIVYMKVPTFTQYTSEGRIETRNLSSASVKSIYQTSVYFDTEQDGYYFYIPLKLSLSFTYFFNSKIRVWHVILSSTSVGITEFDLIKLMKFFSGLQESESYASWIQLLESYTFTKSMTDKVGKNLVNFIFDLIQVNYAPRNREISKNSTTDDSLVSMRNIQSGLVQIDTDGRYIDFPQSGLKANLISIEQLNYLKAEVNKAYDFIYDNNRTLDDFLQNLSIKDSGYYKNSTKLIRDNTEYLFKALCGITQGIYDFERIGFEEVADTLEPRSVSKTKRSFLTINRAVFTSFGYDDNVIDATWRTTGFNPYILISSTVLTQNDFVSQSAENVLNGIMNSLRGKKIKLKKDLTFIRHERDKVDSWLSNDILPNVFQYKTEQDLYEYGMEHMGINARIRSAKEKLTVLKEIINETEAERNNKLQRSIQLILSWIAVFQIFPLVKDLFIHFKDDSITEEQYLNSNVFCILWEWELVCVTLNFFVNLTYFLLISSVVLIGIFELRSWIKERKQPLANFSDGYYSRNFL